MRTRLPCHEECNPVMCVHRAPPLTVTQNKPRGIFANAPPAHLQGVPYTGAGRVISAGAEGCRGGRCSMAIDNAIDRVTNSHCGSETMWD